MPGILKRLLDAGADPNSPDPQGTTALMISARTDGGTEAVKLLLERGANVNARDSVQTSALMWAVRSNHPEAVDLLIHHDAEVNARTRKGDVLRRGASRFGRRIARARHRPQRLARTRISGAYAWRNDGAALCRSRRPHRHRAHAHRRESACEPGGGQRDFSAADGDRE